MAAFRGCIRWLAETKPDVAPPGTESTLGEVSRSRYRAGGYGNLTRAEKLERRRESSRGQNFASVGVNEIGQDFNPGEYTAMMLSAALLL